MPMKKIKELFIKYKEIIMYLIFGVATTGVNWVVYSLLMKAVLVHAPGSDDVKMTVSNVIAWIAAVIFAFITNKLGTQGGGAGVCVLCGLSTGDRRDRVVRPLAAV